MRACCRILLSRCFLLLLPAVACSGCSTDLPEGTTEITVGRTRVRTDSVLDVIGVVYRLADTANIPVRGPVRQWLTQLRDQLGDSAVRAARAPGPIPVSLVLETYVEGEKPDTACGWIARGERRCFTGNAPVKTLVRAFLQTARGFAPRTAGLDLLSSDERRRDLADVWVALTRGKSLDSAVVAYTGYTDMTFDVTLARTLHTGGTTAALDPARQLGDPPRIFLTPDAVFATRSFRSPNYVWLYLGHQMMHLAVTRLFREHPAMLTHGFRLRDAAAAEMARVGYDAIFWDEALGEQLARALTIRMMQVTMPSITWAARTDAVNNGMALVPWLEDMLMRYEQRRDSFPNLGAFVGELSRGLDSIPTDSCKAAPVPGVALIGVARHRAIAGWMAENSPFREKRLLVGDTVVAIDGDSVSTGGLLVPTRQVNIAWAQHLPYELGILDIRRGGRDYTVQAPINWVPREQLRIASQSRAALASDSLPICRWVTRARRPRS